jgi:hypothetical protein
MRRFAATWICVVVVAPLLYPFLSLTARDPQANLPACCRRDGKHHCAMTATETGESSQTQLKTQPEACPFHANTGTVSQIISLVPRAAAAFYAELISHPSVQEQTLAKFRLSEARSHLKRGPPAGIPS